MKLVAGPGVRAFIQDRGGAMYVWPRTVGFCRGRTHVLEAAIEPPERPFELVHASDGFQVYGAVGLLAPAELHLDLDLEHGRLNAYWNGQAWIG